MDPAVAFRVVFYTSKILRIGLIIGIFEAFRRRLRMGRDKTVKSTRLQMAGGA